MIKKSLFYFIILAFSIVGCDKDNKKSNIMVESELLNSDEYLISCKGFPGEAVVNKVQRIELAKEAALINAQTAARQLFNDQVDVIKNGLIKNYAIYDDYVVIRYIVRHKNIKNYLKQ
jgi:hypothetical protein